MKRFLVRLSALGVLVAAGTIAIAQAQRGPQAAPADVTNAPFDPFEGADARPGGPPVDPFAGGRTLSERPTPPAAEPQDIRDFERDLPPGEYQDEPGRFAPDNAAPLPPRGYPEAEPRAPLARPPVMEYPAGRNANDPFSAADRGRPQAPGSPRDQFPPADETTPGRVNLVADGYAPRYGATDPRAPAPEPNYAPGDTDPRQGANPARNMEQGMHNPDPDDFVADPNMPLVGNAGPLAAPAGPGFGHNDPRIASRQVERPEEPAPFPALGNPGNVIGRPGPGREAIAGTSTAVQGTGRPGERGLEGAQVPSIQVQKLAPAEVQVGKPATFEILVRNLGKTSVRQVQVHDSVPRGAEFITASPPPEVSPQGDLTWTLDVLNPGDERVLKVELMPIAEGELGSVATVTFAAEVSVRSMATRPELRVDVVAPAQVMIGEELTLKIKIWNPGTGPATGVVLSEHVPPGLIHAGGGVLEYEVGDLKPGESRELELMLQATKAGQIANLINARADGTLRAEGRTQIHVISPALQVAVTGPKKRFLERQATYTIEVANPGTAPAENVNLVSYVPKGFKFVNADNYGAYDPKTGTVHWSLESLPPNQRGVVTLQLVPVEEGQHTLAVEGSAQHDLKARSEQSVEVEGISAILFQVKDLADPVEVGAEMTYEIQVVNQGTKTATDIELIVQLPPELQPLSADGATRGVIRGQQIFFERLDRLAPRADTTYRVRVRGERAGDLRTQVQLKTAEMETPVTKEESTQVYTDQ